MRTIVIVGSCYLAFVCSVVIWLYVAGAREEREARARVARLEDRLRSLRVKLLQANLEIVRLTTSHVADGTLLTIEAPDEWTAWQQLIHTPTGQE